MPVIRTRSAPSIFRQPLPIRTPRRTRVFTFGTHGRNGERTHPNTPESPTLRIRTNRKGALIRFRDPPAEVHKPVVRADSEDDLNWAVDFSISESPCDPKSAFAEIPASEYTHARNNFAGAIGISSSPQRESEISSITISAPAIGKHDAHSAKQSTNIDDVDSAIIHTFHPTSHPLPRSNASLLLELDAYTGPGLSEKQFQALIVKCRICGRYMTRKAIEWHDCPGIVTHDAHDAQAGAFLDLTSDD